MVSGKYVAFLHPPPDHCSGRFAGNSEIRNPKSEIANLFPAMMAASPAGVAEWQTLGT